MRTPPSSPDDPLARAYAASPPAARARLGAEVGHLLDVAITVDVALPLADQIARIAAQAEQQVATADRSGDAAATRRMVRRLSGNADRAFAGLVRDLAEILWLPRRQRSEYATNRTGAPPYRIGKLLLEYAVGARRIDALLGALTKPYCATACDRLPVGCCSIDGYDMGIVPEALLELQLLEARRRGWRPPATSDRCKFHGDRGCALVRFKSPACVGMLCDDLVAALREAHAPGRLEPFLAHLAVLRNCEIDRERVFAAQRAVIDAGHALIG